METSYRLMEALCDPSFLPKVHSLRIISSYTYESGMESAFPGRILYEASAQKLSTTRRMELLSLPALSEQLMEELDSKVDNLEVRYYNVRSLIIGTLTTRYSGVPSTMGLGLNHSPTLYHGASRGFMAAVGLQYWCSWHVTVGRINHTR